jgi:hypothetical protein
MESKIQSLEAFVPNAFPESRNIQRDLKISARTIHRNLTIRQGNQMSF